MSHTKKLHGSPHKQKRARRRARRIDKQKPVKAFVFRGLARLSKKLFGRNIFKKWFDSTPQPKGTKPNPPWNAAILAAEMQAEPSTAPQETSQPRDQHTSPTSSLSLD